MITLIHGENAFGTRQELEKAIAKKPHQVIFADRADNISDLVFASDNLSLFDNEQKIVILKQISKNRKKSLLNELAEYIEKNNSGINMILYEASKFDARTKLYKIIQKYGKVVESKNLKQNELVSWVGKRLSKVDIKYEKSLRDKILLRVGSNQDNLNNEIEKLRLLLKSENRKDLRIQDLEILTENKEAIIWDFLDALTYRDRKKSLKIFENLYQNESDFPYLSTVLARQLKLLYWIKSQEISEESMKQDFKIHPYTIFGIKRSVNKFDLEFIKLIFSKLTNLDFKVKQGKIDAKLGLIMLIASV